MTTLAANEGYNTGVDMLSDRVALQVNADVPTHEDPEWFADLLMTISQSGKQGLAWNLADGSGRPDWIDNSIIKLIRLLALEENWDSYGAKPITANAFNATIGLLLTFARVDTPPPWIVPTARGGIQLEWHNDENDLEIEILSRTRIEVAYENFSTAETDEFTITFDFDRLADLFARLSR